MCELLTIAAALFFTALCVVRRRHGRHDAPAFTVALMFWGAALMWGVDCVANALAGEGLLDLSLKDAVLGTIILSVGISVYAVLSFIARRAKQT